MRHFAYLISVRSLSLSAASRLAGRARVTLSAVWLRGLRSRRAWAAGCVSAAAIGAALSLSLIMVRAAGDELDPAFNAGGSRAGGNVLALVTQPDGKVIGGGQFTTYNGAAAPGGVLQLGNSGAVAFSSASYEVEETVGDAVITLRRTGGTFGRVSAKVTLTDVTTSPADYRLTPGLLDTTFNAGGAGANIYVLEVATQPDGKVIIGGEFTTYNGAEAAPNYVLRLNSDGTLDSTFNAGGSGPSSGVRALATQPGGKVIIGGDFSTYNGAEAAPNWVMGLNSDGTLDSTFNPGGSGGGGTVLAVATQPDGKVLVGGTFSAYNGAAAAPDFVLRLNSDGTLDSTFNAGGAGGNGVVYALAIQPDGKVLVGGNFTTYNGADAPDRVLRLNSDGTLDATFNAGGTGSNSGVRALATQPDGKIIVGGEFNSYNGTSVPARVLRLNSDGTLDSTFSLVGAQMNNGDVLAVVTQPDGKIIIGGAFLTYNGAAAPDSVLRLNSDGTLDSTFNPGGAGADNIVYALATQPDGKVVIGGAFLTYNGAAAPDSVLRLTGDLFATWEDGDAADKTVRIPIVNDGLTEPNETATLTVTPYGGATADSPSTATLTILPPNSAPTASASPNPATTGEDAPVPITLTGTDADGNTLTFTITDEPDHGALTGQGATPSCSTASGTSTCTLTVTYTPNPNYNGADSFKFKVHNGTVLSAEVTVNITINAVADLSINDVTQAEGNAGLTDFTFTVSLDSPAPTGGVAFNASTSDGTTNPATAGSDYVALVNQPYSIPADGTSTTVTVKVNGDTEPEANETFFVNITNPVNATIADAQGTGTILNDDGSPSTGQIVISEFRLRGPVPTQAPASGNEQGQLDEFIELYNTTDSDFVVVDSSPLPALASRGWAIVSSDALTTAKFTIPVGTRIPARGHYLVTNALGYSLSLYAEADVVPQEAGGGSASYNADIPDNAGLALFRTGNPAVFAVAPPVGGVNPDRLDTAGFTGSTFVEGTGLTPVGGITTALEHSFVRKLTSGLPQDTQDNEADFFFVEVNGATSNGRTAILGAPGPENFASPLQRNATMPLLLLDSMQPAASPPNRSRDFTSDPSNNSTFGTLTVRRRVVNNTGQGVSQLRFRMVNITSGPAPTGTADLRVRTSTDVMISNIMDAATCADAGAGPPPCTVTVEGTVLEEPPAQPNGGGWNSTLRVPVLLAPGGQINVQFLLGIQQTGAFRFFLNVEALPEPATVTTGTESNLKAGGMKATGSKKEQQ